MKCCGGRINLNLEEKLNMDISVFYMSTNVFFRITQRITFTSLTHIVQTSLECWRLSTFFYYRTPRVCKEANAGWLSVNSEVGAAGQCVQLLSPVLRFSETGSPPQLSVGNFKSEISPRCGPPEQELSTPW